MRKIMLFAFLLGTLGLTACKGLREPTDTFVEDIAETSAENKFSESISFQINASSPEYKATLIYTDEGMCSAETLVISRKESGADIQTISLPPNECFAPDPVYALDVTFDGNCDLLVPREHPASAVWFLCFVWDEETETFIYAPGFDSLSNFSLDYENQLILDNRTASMITSYGMSVYDEEAKDFVWQKSLYWEPVLEDESLETYKFQESKHENGKDITVVEEIVPGKLLMVDKTHPTVAPYFEDGSLWDLDSEKWNFTLY